MQSAVHLFSWNFYKGIHMTAIPPIRVYIGWDSREVDAYEVARFSLERRSSIPVQISPIKLEELRAAGLYWRESDPLASTEFTYSRFLTPALAKFTGWALFFDCDFLWLGDIAELVRLAHGPTSNKRYNCEGMEVKRVYMPITLITTAIYRENTKTRMSHTIKDSREY